MKISNSYISSTIIMTTIILLMNACSSRLETFVLEDDSTAIYPSVKQNDINVKITFCEQVDRSTGNPINAGTKFRIMENADIRALVDIENRFKYKDRDLMFHIDWIGVDGRSFYTKQIILAPTDSSTVLQSSISISPGDREPGEYNFKIYFFRELIAEKKFEILPKFELLTSTGEKISSDIRLYRYKSKKSGKLIGEGTTFTIKEKAKVRALIELENRFVYGRQELRFQLEWIDPDSKSFYEKDIILEPQDSTFIINSYISIPPEKREPGEYALRVSLFDILLQEKKFLLLP